VAAALAGAAAAAAWLWLKALEVADASALPSVALDTGFGRAATLRGALLVVAATCALAARPPWRLLAALGATAAATFAWSGHGAATEGPAAGSTSSPTSSTRWPPWPGSAPCRCCCWRRPDAPRAHGAGAARLLRHRPGLVAVLVASGAINSWFLVGPEQALHLADSPTAAC
jgi:putative copper resistance protein D